MVPLLRTKWLCKKDRKRVLLNVTPKVDKSGVDFGIQNNVPTQGGNAAQRREHDKRIGDGNMSRAGAKCPCCETIMTMADIRVEGCAGRLSQSLMAIVVEGQQTKEYKVATIRDLELAIAAGNDVEDIFNKFPYGILDSELPKNRIEGNSGFRVILYGIDKWRKLFLDRQLRALGTFVQCIRQTTKALHNNGYTETWVHAIHSNLAICVDKIVDSSTTITHWQVGGEFSVNTLQRFALPMSWDFSEINIIGEASGSFRNALNWVALANDHFDNALRFAESPQINNDSVSQMVAGPQYDVILTDPPYYDAIAYSDVMDLFYNWLRRT
jgi:putative DNA methylase